MNPTVIYVSAHSSDVAVHLTVKPVGGRFEAQDARQNHRVVGVGDTVGECVNDALASFVKAKE